jgi:V/A-type H+/Na+-transporting ATPase subunit D
MTVKLTKNELRDQQHRLSQLEKYLPTLQLKKAMLQSEVFEARIEAEERAREEADLADQVEHFARLLNERMALDMQTVANVREVSKSYENIAGVEIPFFIGITFEEVSYTLFDTPLWVDSAIAVLREQKTAEAKTAVAHEKVEALVEELRQVSIRVNLFEKILIPRAEANIKKIRIFLGDQQLAAVSQAKVAKAKIVARKLEAMA